MATITGNSANNQLNGTNLADQIFGLAGNDRLIGLDGDDVLEGGAGADELFGSGGLNDASYASSNAAVDIDLANFDFTGGHAAGDQLYGIAGVIGSAYGDFIEGDDYANFLRGLAGNDELFGNGGDDTLEGGAGADKLFGDAGLDFASYASSNAAVNINLFTNSFVGGHAAGDQVLSIEGVIGSAFADTIFADDYANVLRGEGGNDFLYSWGGKIRSRVAAATTN